MTQEQSTPVDFWGRIQKMIDDAVAKLARSGMLQNAAISNGGLTIKGGFLKLLNATAAAEQFYVGPVNPALPDGTPQPGVIFRREDGTVAMALYDGSTTGTFKQYLAIYDRAGNVILGDDTDSGQGIARPWLSGGFAATNYVDFRLATASTSFVTLADQFVTKQQPRMNVYVRSSMDTSGSTGEVRVLVDGVQLGSTASQSFAVIGNSFTGTVDGSHMATVHVEIQARVTGGAGSVKLEPVYWKGLQT